MFYLNQSRTNYKYAEYVHLDDTFHCIKVCRTHGSVHFMEVPNFVSCIVLV